LVAPVEPLSVEVPGAVGVPETVQMMDAPGPTVVGGVGAQLEVRPAGNPAIAQDALVAATAGEIALVQVYVPEYGILRPPLGGRLDRSIDMSEPLTVTPAVAVLLPPAVAPPLVSFVAPVVTETVTAPAVVGVPETGHEILAPAATAAGGTGVHVPTVTPAGNPLIEHVAARAPAVAAALLVHSTVPEYGTPISAVAGNPERSGCMSEPVMAMVVVSVLLPVLKSFDATVRPFRVDEPTVVGVPETVQRMLAPGATVAGVAGAHTCVSPAGNPDTEQSTLVAAIAGDTALVHV
jgi:hypothetical protein